MYVTQHIPVLAKELLHLLQPERDRNFVDATYGGGGMAASILDATEPDGKLIAFDSDIQAIESAQGERIRYGDRLILINDNFVSIESHVTAHKINPIHGVYGDLGISSDQLNNRERGFSFRYSEAQLDLRMGKDSMNAADLLNVATAEDLNTIIREYGEEAKSEYIAREIVRARSKRRFSKVGDLLAVIEKVYGTKRRRIHPATKVWQALRIAVNDELGSLRTFIPLAFKMLTPGGRLVLISFHSLEDRIVKRAFRTLHKEGRAEILTRKVVTPTQSEIRTNPRSRSAKLRALQKK